MTLTINTTTTATSDRSIAMSCSVVLSDEQQLIVEIPELASYSTTVIGKRKFRIEVLEYRTSYGDEQQFGITTVRGRGFCKDGSLRVRDEWIHISLGNNVVAKELLKQIPDDFHDLARETFVAETGKLQEDLNQLIANGLKVGA